MDIHNSVMEIRDLIQIVHDKLKNIDIHKKTDIYDWIKDIHNLISHPSDKFKNRYP